MPAITPIQTKLQGLYNQITDAAKEAKAQIARIDSEIGLRITERERLMQLPLSKADFIKQFRRQVQGAGSAHAMFMKKDISKLDLTINYAKRTDAGFDFMTAGRGIGQTQVTQTALCYFFEDQIVDGVQRAIQELDWPQDGAETLEQVEAGIKRLDEEIEALEVERGGYIEVLRSYKIIN